MKKNLKVNENGIGGIQILQMRRPYPIATLSASSG